MSAYIDIDGVALAIVAKVGSQSFTESGTTWYVSDSEVLVYPERIFFIRDPFQRLESAYSFFVGLDRAGAPHPAVPESALVSWNEFVNFILDPRNDDDEHWIPQTDTVLYTGNDPINGSYIPTKIMRFEDVTDWWPNFFSRRLPHINKSTRLITTSHKGAEIELKYAKDFEVYNKLTKYDDIAEVDRGWPLKQRDPK